MNPLECLINESSQYRLIIRFSCECEQNRYLTDTKEYTSLILHLQKTGVGGGSPEIRDAGHASVTVFGFLVVFNHYRGITMNNLFNRLAANAPLRHKFIIRSLQLRFMRCKRLMSGGVA